MYIPRQRPLHFAHTKAWTRPLTKPAHGRKGLLAPYSYNIIILQNDLLSHAATEDYCTEIPLAHKYFFLYQ